MTKDGWGLSTPTIHAHRHFDLLPLSFFCRGLVGLLIRLCCCFGLAVLLLGPSGTYLTSYSVRGVGCSRPEPWTRLHCSATGANQWHSLLDSLERPWAAKPAHMDREFLSRISGSSAGPLVGRVVFILDFRLTLCFCYAAMHCRYFCCDEDTLGAPEQFCRYFSVWRRRDNAYFDDESIAAASRSIGTTTRCWLCLIMPGMVFFLTWHGSHIHPETHKFVVAGYGWSLT